MPHKALKTVSPLTSAWQGAGWKILASLCFAIIGALAKALSKGNFPNIPPLSIYQIVFIENLVALTAIIAIQGRPSLRIFQTQLWSLQIMRVLFASAGILVWYTALFAMPISQAIALSFMGPVVTVIGAYLFLKEPLSTRRIFAIALSILGAFVIMRPDLALMGGESLILSLGVVSFLPILSTMLFSGAKITARALAIEGETATTMTIYIFMGLAPVSLLPAMLSWQPLVLQHVPFLFGMGLLASVSHWMTAHSYTHAHINFLTPFSFVRLMAGTAIGWWAFDEHLNLSFWLGSGLIVLSVLLLAYERKYRKQEILKESQQSMSLNTDRAA